jgi:hypothetical protein
MSQCCDKCDARQIPPVLGGHDCWDENCSCHKIQRLRAALEVCGAEWTSSPGTVMSAAQELSAEFRRRMDVAATALAND